MIEQRFLVQRHADAPDDAAHDLAPCGLGVEDAPRRHRIDDTRDADDAKLLVNFHLREDRGMRIAGVLAVVLEIGGAFHLAAIHAAVPHRVRK